MLRNVILSLVCCGVLLLGCESIRPEEMIRQAEQAIQVRQYESAISTLRAVLRSEPSNARARWLLAESYIEIEDGPSAEKELVRALELGVGEEAVLPMLAKALVMQARADDILSIATTSQLSPLAEAELEASRAQAFIMKGNMLEAGSASKRALLFKSGSPYVRYVNAKTLFNDDETDAAERELRNLVQEVPTYAQAWSLLGRLLGKKKDFLGAEEAYSNAIRNRYYSAKDRIDRGFARLAMGKLDKALEDADVLLQLAPEMHRVHLLSGLISFERQEMESAKEALEIAYAKKADDLWTMVVLATVHTYLGNFNQGRSLADKAFAIAPQNVSVRKLVAGYALRDGNGTQAELAIKPVALEYPDDLHAKQLWAGSLLAQGKVLEGADLAEQVAEQLADSADVQTWAGAALMAAGKKEVAINRLSKAALLAPDSARANNLLVLGLLDSRSSDDALAAAENFATENRSDPEAQNLLALTHLVRGDRSVAVSIFKGVLELDPSNLTAIRTLVGLSFRAGDVEAARGYLDTAIDNAPRHFELLIMRAELADRESARTDAKGYLARAIEANPTALRPRVLLAQHFFDDGAMEKVLDLLAEVDTSEDRYALALKAAASTGLGLTDGARSAYEALAEQEPGSVDVLLALLRIYSQQDDGYEERVTVERLVKLLPDDERVQLAQATLMAKDGRLNEARSIIAASSLPADDPRLLSARLALSVAEGNGLDAVSFAKQLHELQANARSAVVLSRAQVSAGDELAGASTLERWLRVNPRDVVVIAELASLRAKQGDLPSQQALNRKILEVEPENVSALNNLAWSLLEHAPGEALKYARSAYERAPSSPAVMDTLALAYAKNLDFENALRFVSKAIDTDPDAAEFRLHRAQIRHELGDNEGASMDLRAITGQQLPDSVRFRVEALLRKIEG